MGKTPNSNNGQLFIQTDQPFYMAGDNVTGKVFFNLAYPFDSEVLYLSIKGYESVFFEEQRSRTEGSGEDARDIIYYVPFEQKNAFLKTQVPLRTWPGQNLMPAGQYTFPFAFPLQAQLPGTYFEESPGSQQPKFKGVVKYKVKAYLTGARGEKIKISQPIVIREPLKQAVEGQFKESLVKPTTWCCIGQGESTLKCYFEKNVYTPGETARLKAEIDNSKCSLNITDLTCYLIKTLHLKADGHEFNRSDDLQRNVCQGVKANEKAVGDQCRYCEILINKSNSKEAQPSTNGKLVQCTYSLRSLANLDGCICCSNEPEIIVPIAVTSLPPPNFQFFQPPPNWNPQVFPVVNVAVPYQQQQQQYPETMPPPQMAPNNPPMGQQQQQYPNPALAGQYPNQPIQQPYPNQGQQLPQAVPTYPNQQQQQQQYQQPGAPNQPYNQPQQQQQQVPQNSQQVPGNPLQIPQQQGQFMQNNQDVPKPYVDKPPEVDHRPQMAPPSFDQYPPNNNNPVIPNNNGNFNNQGGQNFPQQGQNKQGLIEINKQPLQGGIVNQEMTILQSSLAGNTPTPQSGFPLAQPQNNANNYPPSGQQQQFGGPGQIPNQQNIPSYPQQQGVPQNGFNNAQSQPGQQGQYAQPLQANDVILQNNPNQNPQQQLLSQQNNPVQQQQGGYSQPNQAQQAQQNQGNFSQANSNNFGNQNINQNFQNQPNFNNNNQPQNQQNFGGPGNQYPQQGQFFKNPAGEQQGFFSQQGAQR